MSACGLHTHGVFLGFDMSSSGSVRQSWIDVARCFAMFIIMWLHVGYAPNGLGEWVGGGLCLFFLLAGYFLPQDTKKIAKRGLSFTLAWVIWTAITTLIYYFLVWRMNVVPTWPDILGIGGAAWNTPLWFLRNLALFTLLIAGLSAIKVLPKYKWLVWIAMLAFSYVAEPNQHETLRFDWMRVMVLGFCLREFSLQKLHDLVLKHPLAITGTALAIWAQPYIWERVLAHHSLSYTPTSLPMSNFAICIMMLTVSALFCQKFPQAGFWIARTAPAMMFIFVSHGLFYILCAYPFEFHPWGAALVPLIVLPLLTILWLVIKKHFPRFAKFLMGVF